jgi:hypothetical protein
MTTEIEDRSTADLVNDLYWTKRDSIRWEEVIKEILSRGDWWKETDIYFGKLTAEARQFRRDVFDAAKKLAKEVQ